MSSFYVSEDRWEVLCLFNHNLLGSNISMIYSLIYICRGQKIVINRMMMMMIQVKQNIFGVLMFCAIMVSNQLKKT